MKNRSVHVFAAVAVGAAGSAFAQNTNIDFEAPAYSASAAGTLLTNGFMGPPGQAGWFNPVAGSEDFNVFTYAGNTHGFNPHPTGGGDQFVVGRFGISHGRAQQNHNFGTANVWKVTYDTNVLFSGLAGASNNIGSLSLQDSTTTQSMIALHRYAVPATPTAWEAVYIVYTAAGGQITNVPGPEWQNLPFNTWFEHSFTVDFTTHRVTQVTIKNLTTGVMTSISPADWYLQGGSASALPIPTMFRLFNSGTADNIGAWDNVRIEAVAAPCYPDCNGDGNLNLADFGCFQTKFALGDPYADCNGDGNLNLADFGCFQTKFALGCP